MFILMCIYLYFLCINITSNFIINNEQQIPKQKTYSIKNVVLLNKELIRALGCRFTSAYLQDVFACSQQEKIQSPTNDDIATKSDQN